PWLIWPTTSAWARSEGLRWYVNSMPAIPMALPMSFYGGIGQVARFCWACAAGVRLTAAYFSVPQRLRLLRLGQQSHDLPASTLVSHLALYRPCRRSFCGFFWHSAGGESRRQGRGRAETDRSHGGTARKNQ